MKNLQYFENQSDVVLDYDLYPKVQYCNENSKVGINLYPNYVDVIYNISTIDENTKLYDKTILVDGLFIDDVEVKVLNEYKFNTIGEHNVKIYVNKNVETFDSFFSANKNIKSVDFTNFNGEKIKSFNGAFFSSTIEKVNFGNDNNFPNVVSLLSTFASCQNLKNISFKGVGCDNITAITAIFNGCLNLEEVDLNGFENTKIKSLDAVFSNCQKLKKIDIEKINTSEVTSMSYSFNNCYSLEELDLTKNNFSNLQDANYPFLNLSNLKTFKLGSNMSMLSNSSMILGGNFISPNCDVIIEDNSFNKETSTNYRNLNVNTLTIGDNSLTNLTFFGLDNAKIKKLTVGENFGKNFTDSGYLFRNNYYVEEVDLSKMNSSNLISTQFMFNECKTLKKLNIDNFDFSNVHTLYNMFYKCENLENIDFSRIKSSPKIENFVDGMFIDCLKITSLDLSNFDLSYTKTARNMFGGCSNLSFIKLSGSIEKLKSNETNYTDMFKGISSIGTLEIIGNESDWSDIINSNIEYLTNWTIIYK